MEILNTLNSGNADQIVWDIAKTELRRKFVASNAYKRKPVTLKISELSKITDQI